MAKTFQGIRPITFLQSAEDDVVLAVTTGGSDGATAARPARLTRDDHSALPFETIAAALEALPKGIGDFTAIVNIGAGNFDGHILSNVAGAENALQIIGTWEAVTATTGLNTGTAGTSTSANAIKKPTGADDWTADEFENCLIRCTGGAGYVAGDVSEVVATILSNTVDTLVLGGEGIPGADNTTQFEIVLPGTVIDTESTATYLEEAQGLGFVNCNAEIIIRRIKFDLGASDAQYGLFGTGNLKIDVAGCWFADSEHLLQEGQYVNLSKNVLTDGAFVKTSGITKPRCTNTLVADGRLEVRNFGEATYDYLDIVGCTGNGLTATGGKSLVLGVIADDNAATPVVMRACDNMSIGSYGLSGTNADTTYGLDIAEGGHYFLVGSTITGWAGSQVYLEGRAIDYTSLASYAVTRRFHTTIQWGSATERILSRVRIDVEADNNGNELSCAGEGVFGNQIKMFGRITAVSPADGEIDAVSAGGQSVPGNTLYQTTHITGFDGASVDHASVTLTFTAGSGSRGYVINDTEYIIDLYPPNTGEINGLGNNNPIYLPPGSWAFWKSVTTVDFSVLLVETREVFRENNATYQALIEATGAFPSGSTQFEDVWDDGAGTFLACNYSGDTNDRTWFASVDGGYTFVETTSGAPDVDFRSQSTKFYGGYFWLAGFETDTLTARVYRAAVNPSTGAITFTSANVPASLPQKLMISPTRFVIVADDYYYHTTNPVSVAWTQGTARSSTNYRDNWEYYSLSSRFLGSTGDVLAISTDDGLTFTEIAAATVGTNPYATTMNATRIVVFGGSGNIYTSDNDGASWTSRSSGHSSLFRCGGYSISDGQFYGGSQNGDVSYSADGITWTRVIVDSGKDFQLVKFGYRSVVFVDWSWGFYVYSSEDYGVTWTTYEISGDNAFMNTIAGGTSSAGTQTFILGGSDDYPWIPRLVHLDLGNEFFDVPSEDRTINTNTDSLGQVNYRLPSSPREGEEHSFYVDDVVGLSVTAQGSHTIRLGAMVSIAAGSVTSSIVGAWLTLKYRGSNKWIACKVEEDWDVEIS